MTGIREIPLGRLFERRKILGFVDEPMLSVYRDRGVVLKDEDLNPNKTAEDRSIYQLVEPGWLVVNRMKAWQGSVGVSELRGIVSGHYICFRPTHTEVDRYLHYLIRSAPVTARLRSISRGVRPGQIEIDNDELAGTTLSLPEAAEQRWIADFLDDRVARIDRIIDARGRQIECVREQVDAQWGGLDDDLRSRHPMVPIRRVLRSIVDGPFGSSLTSAHYSDDGTRVIRLGNVGIARFRDADRAFVSDEYASELVAHAVASGDLIMAGLGDERWPLGRCVVAPPNLGPAIVKADCYRLRLDSRVEHRFAAAFLSGPWSRAAFQLLARGSTRARLNTGLARDAEIPLAPREVQRSYCSAVARLLDSAAEARATLERSVSLLTEYKQSLITAAVTGELDVTTAGSGIPG